MEHFVPVTVGILTHQFLWLLTEAYSLSKGSWKQWVKSHQSLDQKRASPGVSPFVFLQTLSGCSLFQAALHICHQGGGRCNLRVPPGTGRAGGEDGQVQSCSRAHDPGGVWTLSDEGYQLCREVQR